LAFDRAVSCNVLKKKRYIISTVIPHKQKIVLYYEYKLFYYIHFNTYKLFYLQLFYFLEFSKFFLSNLPCKTTMQISSKAIIKIIYTRMHAHTHTHTHTHTHNTHTHVLAQESHTHTSYISFS